MLMDNPSFVPSLTYPSHEYEVGLGFGYILSMFIVHFICLLGYLPVSL